MFVNDTGYVLLHDLRRSWTLIPDEGLQAFQVLWPFRSIANTGNPPIHAKAMA